MTKLSSKQMGRGLVPMHEHSRVSHGFGQNGRLDLQGGHPHPSLPLWLFLCHFYSFLLVKDTLHFSCEL